MDTYNALRTLFQRLELEYPPPQCQIEKYEEELGQILGFPDGYVSPSAYHDKSDEKFLIEWSQYGLFCEFQPSSGVISSLSNEHQMVKQFSADEFVKLLPSIVPLKNSTKIYKVRSRTNKFIIIKLLTITCSWTYSDDEGCEENNIVTDPQLILPEGFTLYSISFSLFDKVDKEELESIVLSDIIQIKENDDSISELKIESEPGKIKEILQGGETYNYF